MLLSFELTMPNVGSWNGKWTGTSKKYYRFRNVVNDIGEKIQGRNFYYNFGDGWGANVEVEKIDSVEKRRREKISAGFCGYEWMIDSIIKNEKIIID